MKHVSSQRHGGFDNIGQKAWTVALIVLIANSGWLFSCQSSGFFKSAIKNVGLNDFGLPFA